MFLVVVQVPVAITPGQARGGVRYFQSFDGAASVLQGMGIVEFIARSANWVPRTAKSASAQE